MKTKISPQLRRLVGIIAVSTSVFAYGAIPGWKLHVSSDVMSIYAASAAAKSNTLAVPSTIPATARFDKNGRVQVDVHFDCAVGAPTAALAAAGMTIGASIKVATLCVVEGWVSPTAVPSLAAVAGVTQIKLPAYSSRTTPKGLSPGSTKKQIRPQSASSPINQAITQGAGGAAIDGNGVTIMHADQFVTQTNTNGAGVKLGVMSDDVTSLSLIQSRGELPAVQIIAPTGGGSPPATPTDEGTMMLEEVHAIAPGATLLFCGPGTSVEYVSCLQNLIAGGASIIVDDLAYSAEDLMSATGDFAQAVQSVVSLNANVALFTVTENYNGSYWEGAYAPTSLASYGYGPISCSASGQTDYYVNSFGGIPAQTLTVFVAGTYPLTFQWADPYDQNASNFDVYWYNTTTNTQGCVSATGSTATYFGPSTYLDAGVYYLYVMTPDASLSSKFLKLWVGGDGNTELSYPTSGSVVSPQAFVPGVIKVGAVNGSDGVGNSIESYSGRGPISLIFPTPAQISAPSFVAPDAVYVDAAGTNFTVWSDGNFHGTSAAAPNAAAVAALLRGAFPNMTTAQVTNALQSGAVQLGATVPGGTFGYGRVDALGALSVYPGPGLSAWSDSTVVGGSSTPPASMTANGFGTLSFSVTSSNPSLIPASLGATGTPGVTLTPATCGNGTSACMVSVTPEIGQIGTATITLIAKDGANRVATTPTTITVTKPSAPTISITSGATQSVTTNSAIAPVIFTLTGTGPLTVTTPTNAISGLTLSSGCGTTTLTCTANLGTAQSTAGTATLTIDVEDSYSQTATATATVTETAPAGKSGGGALDIWTLISLVVVLSARCQRASVWPTAFRKRA